MNPNTDYTKDTRKCTWHLGTQEKAPHQFQKFNPLPPKIMQNVLEAIGHTPLIRLNKIPQSEGVTCEMLVKAEYFNAGGSIKDRIGARMIEVAEQEGQIKPGDTLIEPTSGNTGIGLALTALIKGYKVIVTLPEKMSNEKVDTLKALGAQVVRTPTEAPWYTDESYIGVAKRLQKEIPNSHVLDQYQHSGNALAHYDQTAEEILWQCDNDLYAVVISAGTGGTLTGISRKIKERNPNIKIVAVDPHGSVLAMPQDLNKIIGSYKIEGPGQDKIPRSIDRSLVDYWVKADDMNSFIAARRLIGEEGLLVGGSSGQVVWGAIQWAKQQNLSADKRVVVVMPDGVRNYMTKFLNKDWMIENKFLPLDEYNDPKHPLHGVPFEKLGLQPIKYYDSSLTVGEALQDLSRDARGLPIVENGRVLSVVFENRLLQAVVNKGLKNTDLANKSQTKEFVLVDHTATCVQLERILERHPVVFVEKRKDDSAIEALYAVTTKDMLRLLQ